MFVIRDVSMLETVSLCCIVSDGAGWDHMSSDARHALLTLLENTPEKIIVALTTTDADRFSTMLLRRVARITVHPIPTSAMEKWLMKIAKAELGKVPRLRAAVKKIAAESSGSPGIALGQLEARLLALAGGATKPLSDQASKAPRAAQGDEVPTEDAGGQGA